MYHTVVNEAHGEFIEIYNPTSTPVDLTGWQIRGGVEFDFPFEDPALGVGDRNDLVLLRCSLWNNALRIHS